MGRVNALYSTPSIYTHAKLLQMNPGQSRLMTFSRKINVWMLYNLFLLVFHFNLFLKFEACTMPVMQIVEMHTGQDTLPVDQP